MVIDRGIDPQRMVMFPVTTVQEFRTQALKVLDKYLEQNEADRKPIMLCLEFTWYVIYYKRSRRYC